MSAEIFTWLTVVTRVLQCEACGREQVALHTNPPSLSGRLWARHQVSHRSEVTALSKSVFTRKWSVKCYSGRTQHALHHMAKMTPGQKSWRGTTQHTVLRAWPDALGPLRTVCRYSHTWLTSQRLGNNLLWELSVSPCSRVGGLRAPAHAKLRITTSTPCTH